MDLPATLPKVCLSIFWSIFCHGHIMCLFPRPVEIIVLLRLRVVCWHPPLSSLLAHLPPLLSLVPGAHTHTNMGYHLLFEMVQQAYYVASAIVVVI